MDIRSFFGGGGGGKKAAATPVAAPTIASPAAKTTNEDAKRVIVATQLKEAISSAVSEVIAPVIRFGFISSIFLYSPFNNRILYI